MGGLARPTYRLVQPVLAAVIEKARQLDPGIARLVNAPGKRHPLLVHAHDDGALRRALQHQEVRRSSAQYKMDANLAHGSNPEPGGERVAGEFGNIASGKAEKEQQQSHPEPAVEDIEDESLDGKL